jgi:hypothetical protein
MQLDYAPDPATYQRPNAIERLRARPLEPASPENAKQRRTRQLRVQQL